jgi:lysozyme family protein
MPGVTLTQALKDEYQRLFDTCIITPARRRVG